VNETRPTESAIKLGKVAVNKHVLVVGGGLAGVETALALASLGCEATLVEQEKSLGGNAGSVFSLHGSGEEPARLIESRTTAIHQNRLIHVLLEAIVVGVEGNMGGFRVRIDGAGQIGEHDFGAIIVATGFALDTILEETGFPQKVTSHVGLEKKLACFSKRSKAESRAALGIPKNVCFIVEDSGEDSAIRSASALKNALTIKRLSRSNVFICCQNVNVSGEGLEKLYRDARSHGVVIFKFDDEKPRVFTTDTGFSVGVRDTFAGEDGQWKDVIEINCDLLVLQEQIIPRPNTEALRNLLRVNADSSHRFQENNVWLRPIASNRKGIFFVGGCRGSFDLDDILTEARSTALEVYNLVGRGETPVRVGKVAVDASKCALCLTCLRSCPHGAVEVVFDEASSTKAARIVDTACQACGICVAECPAKAIEMAPEEDAVKRVAVKAQT